MKKALITGVLGQDGTFLSTLLLSKGYEVVGTYSSSNHKNKENIPSSSQDVKLVRINNLSAADLIKTIRNEEPDEIYNLSALSSVAASFENPELTKKLNQTHPTEVLASLKAELSDVKFYQAGSSEMFGSPQIAPQNESTVFNPRSPYAESKYGAFQEVVNLRETKGIYAVNGIMYNHESELRNEQFVSRKITKNIARIVLRKQTKFALGDLTVTRDWGYAGDYVEAMWLMMQQQAPNDYVIATGVSRTLHDFVKTALEISGLDPNVSRWVETDASLFRANEITNLVGDSTKARTQLGWSPQTPFKTWIKRMVEHDIEIESKSTL